jgi:hypothetical protein
MTEVKNIAASVKVKPKSVTKKLSQKYYTNITIISNNMVANCTFAESNHAVMQYSQRI